MKHVKVIAFRQFDKDTAWGLDNGLAPVLTRGATTRDVYLPAGTWQALDDPQERHQGPTTLRAYPAPLDRLPAFRLLGPDGQD